MEEFDHICNHPGCYTTENDATMYKVQSRRGPGSFEVCGQHLMERDLPRTEVIVTAKTASRANAEILEELKR